MSAVPLQRSGVVAYGGALPALDGASDDVRQLHRTLPYTRLVDYGMDQADARELLWRTARGDQWTTAAIDIGRRQAARSRTAAAEGRMSTLREAARAAAAALNVAQIPISRDEPQKQRLYAGFQEWVGRYAQSRGRMERLRVAYDGVHLEGWLVLPRGEALAAAVVFGGLSGWGATYLALAERLAEVGLATVLAEGPGQGGSRFNSHVYGSSSTIAGYSAFVRFAAEDASLGGAPVGIVGISFGGMIAARIAAQDPRVAACVINGSPSEVVPPSEGDGLDQMLAFVGTDSRQTAAQAIAQLAFDPAEHRIRVPLLVLHGEADALVSTANISRFLAAAEGDATLLAWPDGEHTLHNHSDERNALVADWLRNELAHR